MTTKASQFWCVISILCLIGLLWFALSNEIEETRYCRSNTLEAGFPYYKISNGKCYGLTNDSAVRVTHGENE